MYHPIVRTEQRRRDFLRRCIAGSTTFFTVPGAFAESLHPTPSATEGPFYPDKLPLDRDNDLIIVGDDTTPAIGEITWLHGTILNINGSPIDNARIEIWQVDSNGQYIHSHSGGINGPNRDTHFQGFGQFVTGKDGTYQFRTLKPALYPGRCPHIHIAVYQKEKRVLTTQCFVKGASENLRDGVFQQLGQNVDLLTPEFAPKANSTTGELTAHLNLVIGHTPEAPR